MNEAPPPPPAPGSEPRKDRKTRRREKFGPSLDEQVEAEDARREFEGGRPVSAADWADAETIAQRVFSGREVAEEKEEDVSPKEPVEMPGAAPKIPHDELLKNFEAAIEAAIPASEEEPPSPARATPRPEHRRAANRAARPAEPRREASEPESAARREVEVTGISEPGEELAAAGVTRENLAAHYGEIIKEIQRQKPEWQSATGIGGKPKGGGAREASAAPKANKTEPAPQKSGKISPEKEASASRPPETEELLARYYEALKASETRDAGSRVRKLRRRLEGTSRDEAEKIVRDEMDSRGKKVPPEGASATGLDADGAAAAPSAAPRKNSRSMRAQTVWPPADDSASRLAGYHLEKRGLRGAEFDAALPAETRKRGAAIREAAAEPEPARAARKKRQPILQNVPDAVPPATEPEPIDPDVLARDAASIQKQRATAAREVHEARAGWKEESRDEARVDALTELDKKIESARRRAPKKGTGADVRAAVAAVAEASGRERGPASAAEIRLTGPGSFENFYATLRARAPEIVGGAQEYTADGIIEIVEAIRRGEPGIGLDNLTRTFGIREAATRLIENERIEKTRAALGIGAAPSPAVTAPEDAERFTEDDYRAALEVVFEEKKASTSLLQRRLRFGYQKSRDLLDELARRGVIDAPEGALPRTILVSRAEADATVAASPTPAAVTPARRPRPPQPQTPAAATGVGGAGGGTPPPPGNVPPVPPAPDDEQEPTMPPPLPPRRPGALTRAADALERLGARVTASFDRADEKIARAAAGVAATIDQWVGRPTRWIWGKTIGPGSSETKENPFKKQTSIFAPVTATMGWLLRMIGGGFGAKFESPKEDKKK